MDSKQATIWLRTILKCKQNNSTMKKRLAVRKEQELIMPSRFSRFARACAVPFFPRSARCCCAPPGTAGWRGAYIRVYTLKTMTAQKRDAYRIVLKIPYILTRTLLAWCLVANFNTVKFNTRLENCLRKALFTQAVLVRIIN